MEIISQSEAREHGLPRYFTGKPCKRGHVEERYVNNGGCVVCAIERVRRWKKENPDKVRARRRANYEKENAAVKRWRAENRQRDSENKKRYRENNRELFRKSSARYRVANREKANAAVARWGEANPERRREYDRRRRAREKNASGDHVAEDIQRLYEQQKGKCVNCRKSLRNGFHVDHIEPLSRGGSNGPENLQLLCPSCNLSKSAKDPFDWARENGRLL